MRGFVGVLAALIVCSTGMGGWCIAAEGPSLMWRDPALLIRFRPIQTELELTEEQTRQCSQAAQQAQDARKSIHDELQNRDAPPTNEDREALSREMRKTSAAFEDELARVLTADQKRRFGELLLQVQGETALLDKDIQLELGFTSQQVDEVARIRRDTSAEVAKLLSVRDAERGGRNDQPTRTQKVEEAKRVGREKLVELLTAEQQARFDELRGQPFDWQRLAAEPQPGRKPTASRPRE